MRYQMLPTLTSPRPAAAVLVCMWVVLLLLNLLLVTAQGSSNAYVIHIESNSNSELDTNSTDEPVPVCVADKPTRCMCGNAITAAPNRTTCKNETNESQDSPLGFCQEVLTDLNYDVKLWNVSKNECMMALTEKELTSARESIQYYRKLFTDILKRTIVGVYLKSVDQRCTCLEAYKQWLCTTKLPLVTNATDQNDSEVECMLESGSRVSLEQLRPCLSVCHRVLQSCPYYNPSEFQTTHNTSSRSFPDEESPLEIIYGGFPAFDCPDPQLLRLFNIVNKSSYSLEDSCIGRSSSSVLHIPALARLFLITVMYVFCVS